MLLGGSGEDHFVYSAALNEGHDTIGDFDLNSDTLNFYDVLDTDGSDPNSINDYLDNITISLGGTGNADVTLTASNGTQITLEGINSGGAFTAYDNHSLGDLLNANPDAIKVEVDPNHYAT